MDVLFSLDKKKPLPQVPEINAPERAPRHMETSVTFVCALPWGAVTRT